MCAMGEPDLTKPRDRETPFFLVYGAEACLPLVITLVSPWVQAFNETLQEELR